MRAIIGQSKVTAALAMILLATSVALAYETTAFEKAELAQLSPPLRSQVDRKSVV